MSKEKNTIKISEITLFIGGYSIYFSSKQNFCKNDQFEKCTAEGTRNLNSETRQYDTNKILPTLSQHTFIKKQKELQTIKLLIKQVILNFGIKMALNFN